MLSGTDPAAVPSPPPVEGRTRLHLLVEDAVQQLNICNACRYCEGLCAVFPALERRRVLDGGDISQIANLCHDCRACFDACMYTAPHEFDLNIPKVLSAVRVEDYRRYVWPRSAPRLLSGWRGIVSSAVASCAVVAAVAAAHAGISGLTAYHETPQSPYELIPYPVLLLLILLPACFSVVVMAAAGRAYWREIGPPPRQLSSGAVLSALLDGLRLRYLRGGGVDCYYPEDERPSPARRRLHMLVVYGFMLCVVSTAAAGVLQDIMGSQPPYPWLSVPVISGTVGGVGLLAGCVGLIELKRRSSPVTSFAAMTVKDYGFLFSLAFLALSGMLVLLTRDTAAFGVMFLVHFAAVAMTFGAAPYSKFVHLIFRYLALVRDRIEAQPPVRAGGSK
ncbi:MAG TPA: tricarballylate utilization 4Fe-4S protein TcuB [Actinocrinis sp.]|jgi:citrate/tricarballylate utilization protein